MSIIVKYKEATFKIKLKTIRLRKIKKETGSKSIEYTLKKLICKATNSRDVILTETCTFKDLGVDSMSVVQILVSLEDILGIDIVDEDLKQIHNMGAFIKYLKLKVDEKDK